jgi:salicylate synthetase
MDSFRLQFPDSQTKRVLLSSSRNNILHFTSPSRKTSLVPSSNVPITPFTSPKGTPSPVPRLVVVLPASTDGLETTVVLLKKYKSLDHYAYERKDVWHIGLGSRCSLRVDPTGKKACISGHGKERNCHIPGFLTDFVRNFVKEQSEQYEGRMFGQVGFNYGAHVRGQSYTPGRWPILSISKQSNFCLSYPELLFLWARSMSQSSNSHLVSLYYEMVCYSLGLVIPELEITVRPEGIILQGYDEELLTEVCDFLRGTSASSIQIRDTQPVNTQSNEVEYKGLVSKALKEIRAGKYSKVIASRFVDLDKLVDMPATLLHGRRANNPARSYTLNHGGFQATGFSPELVMAFQKGMVVTE